MNSKKVIDKCNWKEEEEWGGDLVQHTSCGRAYCFDGTLDENGYKFCPFCGKEIKETIKRPDGIWDGD